MLRYRWVYWSVWRGGGRDDRGLNATIQVGLLVSMEGEGSAMIEA